MGRHTSSFSFLLGHEFLRDSTWIHEPAAQGTRVRWQPAQCCIVWPLATPSLRSGSPLARRRVAVLALSSWIRGPKGNGIVERLFKTLKEQMLWPCRFHSLPQLREALHAFRHGYNHEWLIERLGYSVRSCVQETQGGTNGPARRSRAHPGVPGPRQRRVIVMCLEIALEQGGHV